MFPFPLLSLYLEAESISLSPLQKPALVGITYSAPTYTVSPSGTEVRDVTYSVSDTSVAKINPSTGEYVVLAKGGFDVIITARNTAGKYLTDSSYAYAYELSVSTPSLDAMEAGDTKQLNEIISPEAAKQLDGLTIEYTTTDPAVATIDSSGVITAVADGGCRVGCTVTYKGVSASDTSYLSVNSAATSIYLAPPSETSYPVGEEVQLAFSTIPEGSTMHNPQIVITQQTTSDGCDIAIVSESATYSVINIVGHQAGTYKFYVSATNNLGAEIVSSEVSVVVDASTVQISL